MGGVAFASPVAAQEQYSAVYRTAESIEVVATRNGLIAQQSLRAGDRFDANVLLFSTDCRVDTYKLEALRVEEAISRRLVDDPSLQSQAERYKAEIAFARLRVLRDVQIARTELCQRWAPWPGAVARIHINVGEYARIGQSVMRIIRTDSHRVFARVPLIVRPYRGQQGLFWIDARILNALISTGAAQTPELVQSEEAGQALRKLDGRVAIIAEVDWVSTVVDESTQTLEIRLRVTDRALAARLREGTSGNVQLIE